MRIATYNLWNAATNWPLRLAGAAEELRALDAHIVCLQEAPAWADEGTTLADYLRQHTGYAHALHLPYPEAPRGEDRPEGLGFLSTLPLSAAHVSWSDGTDNQNSWGARVVVDWQGHSLAVTNVHLDWKHPANRERQIVRIVRELIDAHPADIDILCGDFNDDGAAPSLAYLAGSIELFGHRTCWRDLAADWHAARGDLPPVTLDFEHNPRWKPKKIAAPSKRYDRIYLRARLPELAAAVHVEDVGIFGKEPRNSLGIVPSDHYGLYADLSVKG
jgi:maltose 6'-phosphate phosphatase